MMGFTEALAEASMDTLLPRLGLNTGESPKSIASICSGETHKSPRPKDRGGFWLAWHGWCEEMRSGGGARV